MRLMDATDRLRSSLTDRLVVAAVNRRPCLTWVLDPNTGRPLMRWAMAPASPLRSDSEQQAPREAHCGG
jgi:hypothetical protein